MNVMQIQSTDSCSIDTNSGTRPPNKATWLNRTLTTTGLSFGGMVSVALLNKYLPCSFESSLFRYTISQMPALCSIRKHNDSRSADDPTQLNRMLKTTGISLGGVTSAALLNKYFPCSFESSIFRNMISQLPSLLYFVATEELSTEEMQAELAFAIETDAKFINNIGQNKDIQAARCAAWLNTSSHDYKDRVAILSDAIRHIYCEEHDGSYQSIKTFMENNGWQVDDIIYVQKSEDAVKANGAVESAIKALTIKDALFCFMSSSTMNSKESASMCVIRRLGSAEFAILFPVPHICKKYSNAKSCVEALSTQSKIDQKPDISYVSLHRDD